MPRGRRKKSRLIGTAESIGAGLGHLAAKYDSLVRQRDELAAELKQYMSHAHELLSGLGRTTHIKAGRAERQVIKAVKKAKRTFSPEARKRLSLAAKARWAKAKKAGKTRLG